MRNLTKPSFDARATFELCADNVDDENLRERLKSVTDHIVTADEIYADRGKQSTLFSIPESDNVGGKVTGAEMRKLYKSTFSKLNKPPRDIYDKIRGAAKDICPLCGHRVVGTLDHYLAQSRHPALAVTPLNLVPACTDCNKAKLAKQPDRAEDQTLHPYFDELGEDVWLVATVEKKEPLAVRFKAKPPNDWPDLKRRRLCKHFEVFELAKLYSIQAGVELTQIRDRLRRRALIGGPSAVRESLEEDASSRKVVGPNSWQAAFYVALSESDWFCSDGFAKIATTVRLNQVTGS